MLALDAQGDESILAMNPPVTEDYPQIETFAPGYVFHTFSFVNVYLGPASDAVLWGYIGPHREVPVYGWIAKNEQEQWLLVRDPRDDGWLEWVPFFMDGVYWGELRYRVPDGVQWGDSA